MSIQNVRGTADILPDKSHIWEWLENKARNLFFRFQFKEIRTPIFEFTELFTRSIGEGTDIVTKEMFTFSDKKGRSITLRPEGTASVVRACLQYKLPEQGQIQKLFYIGPMFRYEKPQAGRQRQFHQTGVEIIGSDRPEADVETMMLLHAFFDELGLKNIRFRINTTGSRSFRPELNRILRDKLVSQLDSLCSDCQDRFQKNILRVYDCKNIKCKSIIETLPGIRDFLPDEDTLHFQEVQNGLKATGIPFELDDRLVRGLDYYTRTIYEVYSNELGACDALAGGGRYDNLFQEMGAAYPVPAVGFAIGLERVMQLLEKMDLAPSAHNPEIYVVSFKENMDYMGLVYELRKAGFSVATDLSGKSIKAQFRNADRLKTTFAVIIGEEERVTGTAKLKNLMMGTEEKIQRDGVVSYFNNFFKKTTIEKGSKDD